MDQADPRLVLVREIHRTLSRIVEAVKITPFIYSSIFVVVFVLYNFADERVLDILDTIFYISPIVVVVTFVYSKILHLCWWHRLTCLIPVIPQVFYLFDSFYTQSEVMIANVISLVMIILILISAYKVYARRNKCPRGAC